MKKTIHYKQASFLKESAKTLQQLLAMAIKEKSRVADRVTEPNEAARRVLNDNASRAGCFVANIVQYEPDAAMELITIIESVKSMPVSTEAIENDSEGRKREALKGTLHFGVFENHIGYVGSPVLTWRALETYLNSFLRDAGVLPDENIISLLDAPSGEVAEQVKRNEIRKVNFGQGLEMKAASSTATQSSQSSEGVTEVKKVKMIPTGKVADILSAAFGAEWKNVFKKRSNLAPDSGDIISPEHLRVQLEVGYHRKSSDDDQEVLQSLAGLALSNEDDEKPFEVVLSNGTRIKGSDLVIKGSMDGELVKGVIPTTVYFDKIAKWLVEEYQTGLLSE